MELLIKFTGDEAGASAVEYAFLMGFLAMGVAAGISSFLPALANLFNGIPWPE